MPKKTSEAPEIKLEFICAHCKQPLFSDKQLIYCKTKGCKFITDNLLDFWRSCHQGQIEIQ